MTKYRTTSVRALIRNGGSLLVEWFAPKSIAFLPGGTVEAEEDLEAALVRELHEELEGSSLRLGRYLGEIGHRWKTSNGVDSCLNHYYEVFASEPEKLRAREMERKMIWLPITGEGLVALQPPSMRGVVLGDLKGAPWKMVDSEGV